MRKLRNKGVVVLMINYLVVSLFVTSWKITPKVVKKHLTYIIIHTNMDS